MFQVPFQIRRAVADDADSLSAFARSVFSLGGRPGATHADLEAYFSAKLTPAHFRTSIANAHHLLLVAEVEREIAGYGEIVRDVPAPQIAEPRPSELRKLYVGPRYHGLGIADALMRDLLRDAAHPVWLSVFSENPRAIRFYERWGFKIIGTHDFLVGDDPQQDFVMRRDESKGTA